VSSAAYPAGASSGCGTAVAEAVGPSGGSSRSGLADRVNQTAGEVAAGWPAGFPIDSVGAAWGRRIPGDGAEVAGLVFVSAGGGEEVAAAGGAGWTAFADVKSRAQVAEVIQNVVGDVAGEAGAVDEGDSWDSNGVSSGDAAVSADGFADSPAGGGTNGHDGVVLSHRSACEASSARGKGVPLPGAARSA
jgi:hypothetical protein